MTLSSNSIAKFYIALPSAGICKVIDTKYYEYFRESRERCSAKFSGTEVRMPVVYVVPFVSSNVDWVAPELVPD
jgi:hypothetical protein